MDGPLDLLAEITEVVWIKVKAEDFIDHWKEVRQGANRGQRGQQPPLPLGMANSQVLPSPVELVKLQFHGGCSVAAISMEQAGTGLFRQEGEVGLEPSWDQLHTSGTDLSPNAPEVIP